MSFCVRGCEKYLLAKKKNWFPSRELIFLLQKFHSVELKKKWLKDYRETNYYIKLSLVHSALLGWFRGAAVC